MPAPEPVPEPQAPLFAAGNDEVALLQRALDDAHRQIEVARALAVNARREAEAAGEVAEAARRDAAAHRVLADRAAGEMLERENRTRQLQSQAHTLIEVAEARNAAVGRELVMAPSVSGESRESDVDSLTGLLGEGPLQDHLDREYARSRRYGHALSVLLIDVDKLGRYCKRHWRCRSLPNRRRLALGTSQPRYCRKARQRRLCHPRNRYQRGRSLAAW